MRLFSLLHRTYSKFIWGVASGDSILWAVLSGEVCRVHVFRLSASCFPRFSKLISIRKSCWGWELGISKAMNRTRTEFSKKSTFDHGSNGHAYREDMQGERQLLMRARQWSEADITIGQVVACSADFRKP